MKFRHLLFGIGVACVALPGLASPALAGGFGFGSLWAMISDVGGIVRASGAPSAVKISTGVYAVTFARSLDRCIWTATVRGNVASLVTASRTDPAKGDVLYVYTFAVNGTPANRGFDVIVDCQN